jgi:hypothetical protein
MNYECARGEEDPFLFFTHHLLLSPNPTSTAVEFDGNTSAMPLPCFCTWLLRQWFICLPLPCIPSDSREAKAFTRLGEVVMATWLCWCWHACTGWPRISDKRWSEQAVAACQTVDVTHPCCINKNISCVPSPPSKIFLSKNYNLCVCVRGKCVIVGKGESKY